MLRRFLPAAAILVLVAACATITAQSTNETDARSDAATEGIEIAELNEPGPEHDILDRLRGRWVQDVKFWPEPGAEATEAQSELEFGWLMGGRWIQSRSEAYLGGKRFEGMQIMGYDGYRKLYSWYYIDNMSTAPMHGFGTYDAATRTLTIEGTYDDLTIDKRDQPYRTWWRFAEDGASYEAGYDTPGPDGKMYQRVRWTARRPDA